MQKVIVVFTIVVFLVIIINMFKQNPTKKVIVVGAGISGLAAGRELTNQGYEVTILEAKDYIGGRIKSVSIDGNNYELGANWVHGDKNNPIAKILKDEGALTVPTELETNITYKNGKKVEIDESRVDGFYSLIDKYKADGEDDISLEQIWNKFVADNKQLDLIDQKELYQLLVLNIENELGTNLRNLSTLEFGEEDELNGGDKLVVGGYDKVISNLSKGLDVKLNSIVTKIVQLDNSVKIIIKDGTEFIADEVIVTVPLSVLQKGMIAFEPSLPEYKLNAIKSLGMGNLHKTFLNFEQKFWDDEDIITVYNDEGTMFTDFINLFKATGKPQLLVLHSGTDAEMIANLSDSEIVDNVSSQLQRVYNTATKPVMVVTSKWYLDPFTMGSYSFVPTGASLSMYDEIARPFNKIHFAGEHTNSKYPATTHGAYLSGIRAANEILKD